MAEDADDEVAYPFHQLCADPEFEYEFLLREWILEHPVLLWEWQEEQEGEDDWGLETPLLHYAARFRELEMVRLMLEHGADPNARDRYGRTPLLCIDDSDLDHSPNKVPIMKLLLEHGADPNRANNGMAPLHIAIDFWELDESHAAIDLLVAHGADPNISDNNRDTPLQKAQYWNRAYIVALLHKGVGKQQRQEV